VVWTLDGTKLTISGTGPMYDQFYGADVWGTSVTEAVVESGVTYVSEYAFKGVTRLQTLTLADTVTAMGQEAFQECTQVKSVNLGSGLESIGRKAFYECRELENIALPSSLKSIGEQAFYKTDIKYVLIPAGCTDYSKAFDHNVAVVTTRDVMDTETAQTLALAIAAVGTLLCIGNYIIGRRH